MKSDEQHKAKHITKGWTPSVEYHLIVRCENCYFTGSVAIPKRIKLCNSRCPSCECLTLIKEY